MFRKKKPTQLDLDCDLVDAAFWRRPWDVRKLVAAGANVHYDNDSAWEYAVANHDTGTMRILLEAGVDVHQHEDLALRHTNRYGCCSNDFLQLVRDAISKQDAQREKEKLKREEDKAELERERNPLLAGAGFTFMKFTPEDMKALLREAIDVQSAHPRAPGRDHIPLPQP